MRNLKPGDRVYVSDISEAEALKDKRIYTYNGMDPDGRYNCGIRWNFVVKVESNIHEDSLINEDFMSYFEEAHKNYWWSKKT